MSLYMHYCHCHIATYCHTSVIISHMLIMPDANCNQAPAFSQLSVTSRPRIWRHAVDKPKK